jgi:hypothetical protein
MRIAATLPVEVLHRIYLQYSLTCPKKTLQIIAISNTDFISSFCLVFKGKGTQKS